ncbi:MAG: DUF1592 domain-containing protein [Myxococcota bacterium]|jgi:hypothetical protein|nr:DUF1592 domain-containing protein [Myxococcota bacterium]
MRALRTALPAHAPIHFVEMRGLSALGVLLLACTGEIVAPTGHRAPPAPPSGVSCDSEHSEVRARRLTARELVATLRVSLGVDVTPAALPADERVAGFAANAITSVSEQDLEKLVDVAEDVAHRVVANGGGPSCPTRECANDWLDHAGRRLTRGTMLPDERASLSERYADWATEGTPAEAAELLVATTFLSPRALYVFEQGDLAENGALRLDGLSLASRLSFLLVGRGPDDALLDDAESGSLARREVFEAHARRLAASEEGRAHVTSFLAEWSRVEQVRSRTKHDESFPFWSEAVANAMATDALEFLDEVVRSEGGIAALLGDRHAHLDSSLAPLFGVAPPTDGALTRVELPGRHGLLTLPAFAAAHAHALDPSWVQRGLFVREQLLCEHLPTPRNVDFGSVPATDRVEHPVCGQCHQFIDPIGSAFDELDAAGLPTGAPRGGRVVSEDPELEGDFDSLEELSQRLAEADAVRRCFAQHAVRFAHRRAVPGHACSVDDVETRWTEAGGSFATLLLAVALDESFVWGAPQTGGE